MKTKNILKKVIIACFGLALFSCSSSDEEIILNNTSNPVNSGELRLFVIDTAKINSISASGTNETTLINRKVNLNSYIKQLSIGRNGEKIAYIDVQSNGTITHSLRIINANGTSDLELLSSSDSDFLSIKYCTDNKIHFAKKHRTTNAVKFGTINDDGSGLLEANAYHQSVVDITNDRNFILLNTNSFGGTSKVQIIDMTLDGGAGGTYHTENFPGIADYDVYKGNFTQDGKYAVITYKEGSEMKIRIIDMATKTSTTKTIVTGITSWTSADLELSSDSNRGVLTVMGGDYTSKTKSYLFKINDNTITEFQNNDQYVLNVYPY